MSRAIETSKRPVWIVLGVALLVHAGLISFQAGRRIDTSFIRVWMLDSIAPVEKMVDRSLYSVTHLWDNYFALVGLHRENERLTAEVDQLRMELETQREAILEADRLRKLLAIQESRIGKTVVARVIGRDPARTNQTVTIDKGMVHGVKPDSAVMTPRGVVGRVLHSSNFFSIVQLILDAQSGVGVLHQSTRRQGIVKGSGGPDLELDYIDDDSDLKEGDIFITSGLDRIYPKGLPVGAISVVGPRRGLFKTIQLRPAADLGRLEEVICILDHPDAVDVIDPTQETSVP